VAEHSIGVASLVTYRLGRPDLALSGLLHDAAEAYIGDMVRPMKQLPQFKEAFEEIEQRFERVIGEVFGCRLYPMLPVVKQADLEAYQSEVRNIRTGQQTGMSQFMAREAFLEYFNSLVKETR
jgi:5'-deoxynucleotidase YfbR-like HD superfamily hydrolase